MPETVYDTNVNFYLEFIDVALADAGSFFNALLARFETILADEIDGARVCDIACGEGYLARALARRGAREVVGVDLSTALVEIATERADSPNLVFRVDDAQRLTSVDDASQDVAVSQMALMDIPDHRAVFAAVRRILRPGGTFVFSLLHPCFETPFQAPHESQFLVDGDGAPSAVVVRRYAQEGFWSSGGAGVRGRMGAHHRTLSTLINDLIAAGFQVTRLDEPVSGEGLGSRVPRALLITARAAPGPTAEPLAVRDLNPGS